MRAQVREKREQSFEPLHPLGRREGISGSLYGMGIHGAARPSVEWLRKSVHLAPAAW